MSNILFVSAALVSATMLQEVPEVMKAPEAATVAVVPPADVVSNPSNRLNLELSNGGTVTIQLRPDAAPNHVRRIQTLATQGFYNGLVFHRVEPGFMAQGGDPEGTGRGGSELPDLSAEFNTLPHLRGTMAMARKATSFDSANSQFYIMLATNMKLDRQYTVIGRVVSGMQHVDRIAPGVPPPEPTRIVRAWLDGPVPAAPLAPAQAVEENPAP